MKRPRTAPFFIVMAMAAAWYGPAARGANQVCDGEEHDCGCASATACSRSALSPPAHPMQKSRPVPSSFSVQR